MSVCFIELEDEVIDFFQIRVFHLFVKILSPHLKCIVNTAGLKNYAVNTDIFLT